MAHDCVWSMGARCGSAFPYFTDSVVGLIIPNTERIPYNRRCMEIIGSENFLEEKSTRDMVVFPYAMAFYKHPKSDYLEKTRRKLMMS
ncbi:hypothetical protein Bca101_068022 [Brassica carinata]